MKTKLKAMTLVELICVIAIVAILITIGVVGMKGVRRFRAERQIHTMTGELSDLRKRAMIMREPTQMIFNEDSYVIKYGRKNLTVPYEEDLSFVKSNTSKGKDYFIFSSSGRPSNSGTVTFCVGETMYQVIVAPVSGRIRMERADEKS